MAGMTSVRDLKMGDVIGNANRAVCVVVGNAEATTYGTVKARLLYPDEDGEFGGESYGERVRRREWLLGGEAQVHVREQTPATPELLEFLRDG
jgi:hypothetical protein